MLKGNIETMSRVNSEKHFLANNIYTISKEIAVSLYFKWVIVTIFLIKIIANKQCSWWTNSYLCVGEVEICKYTGNSDLGGL